jgi:anti-sigma factor RsiW
MNCTDIRDRLLAWQYQELPAAERALVTKHLESCAACQEHSLVWRELSRRLDAFTGPAVAVDLPRLFHQVVQRQEQRARRWRRTALAFVAAVAAVLLIAIGLRLEIRLDGSQVVVRWGDPPPVAPQTPAPPSASATVPNQFSVPHVDPDDLQLVKDLVRVLAQEIQTRDRQQQQGLLRLQARFEAFLGAIDVRSANNERDVAALYSAQFRITNKGEKP